MTCTSPCHKHVDYLHHSHWGSMGTARFSTLREFTHFPYSLRDGVTCVQMGWQKKIGEQRLKTWLSFFSSFPSAWQLEMVWPNWSLLEQLLTMASLIHKQFRKRDAENSDINLCLSRADPDKSRVVIPQMNHKIFFNKSYGKLSNKITKFLSHYFHVVKVQKDAQTCLI